MDLNKNFTALDADALATYAAQVRAAFDAIASADAPTEAQVTEAEGYAEHLEAIDSRDQSPAPSVPRPSLPAPPRCAPASPRTTERRGRGRPTSEDEEPDDDDEEIGPNSTEEPLSEPTKVQLPVPARRPAPVSRPSPVG